MSNGEIADHLRISPATAKTHVAHLLTKLDARDRVQLVIIAYQAGLAPAGLWTEIPCVFLKLLKAQAPSYEKQIRAN